MLSNNFTIHDHVSRGNVLHSLFFISSILWPKSFSEVRTAVFWRSFKSFDCSWLECYFLKYFCIRNRCMCTKSNGYAYTYNHFLIYYQTCIILCRWCLQIFKYILLNSSRKYSNDVCSSTSFWTHLLPFYL